MFRSFMCAVTVISVLAFSTWEGAADEPTSARQWITKFDQDGDGKLDETELAAALQSGQETDLAFVRINRDANGEPRALETAIASFRSPDGRQRVDLIAAIHVADKAYYQRLNRLFRDYDVVLYELIAPAGTRIPRGGQASDHPVGRLQRGIKSLLDLTFQLDEIDYTAGHLVHADLSPAEFASSMEERGESFLQILFRMMGHAASQSGRTDGPSDTDVLLALFATDRPLRLKRIFADQFEDLEDQMSILEGANGSTLISVRNQRALDVLKQQLTAGHDQVAIFYGAGHMDDMADRLRTDFQLKYDTSRWLKAWNLSGANGTTPDASER